MSVCVWESALCWHSAAIIWSLHSFYHQEISLLTGSVVCTLLIPQIPLTAFFVPPQTDRREQKRLPEPKLKCLPQPVETNRGQTTPVSTFPWLCCSKNTDCWFGEGRSCSATLPPADFMCITTRSHNTLWGLWRSKAEKIEITKRGNITLKSMLLLFVFAHILLFTIILFNLYLTRKSDSG